VVHLRTCPFLNELNFELTFIWYRKYNEHGTCVKNAIIGNDKWG